MKQLFTIISIFATIALTSCGRNPYAEEIAKAESLAETQPDSALVIMQQTNPRMVTNRKAQAHYNLLYSKILDKNYILLDNDSLIAPAFRYYNAPIRRRFISDSMAYAVNYYYATIRQNARKYHEAVEYFLKSKEYAEKVGDDFILGLIYARISEIYYDQQNYAIAKEYVSLAHEHYNRHNPFSSHATKSLLSKAIATQHLDIHESLKIYEQCFQRLDTLNFPKLNAKYYRNVGNVYNSLLQPEKALHAIYKAQAIDPQELDGTMCYILSMSHLLLNTIDSARYYIDTYKNVATSANSREFIHYLENIYYSKIGEYKIADMHHQCYVHVSDSLHNASLSQHRSAAESEYYRHKANLADMQSKWQSRIYIAIIVIGVIIIIFVTREYRQRTRFKNLEIDRLTESMESMTRLKAQIEQEKNSAIKHVQEYALSKFEIINRLGLPLYERTASKDQQEDIYRQMRNYINALKSDAKMKSELEQLINTAHENIIARIRVQIPKLRSQDIDLLLYILSGFSTQMISILIDDSVPNVYAKKSRLKGRIAASDAPDREFFVKKLS